MENFIGQILPWAVPYAPDGWLFCQGQSLKIANYQALYSILGTKFGGDGRTTFNLPNLQSRCIVNPDVYHQVQPFSIANGNTGGAPTVTLTAANLPQHSHTAGAVTLSNTAPVMPAARAAAADQPAPATGRVLGISTGLKPYSPGATANTKIVGLSVDGTINCNANAAGTPLSLMPPYLGLNYIIAVTGYYPPQPY